MKITQNFTRLKLLGLGSAVLVIAGLIGFISWSGSQTPVDSHGGPVKDYVSLIDNLRGGATVEATGDVQQPFFSVKGYIIKVDGQDVQVFEYQDEAAANKEAGTVSPDGMTIGTSALSWVSDPHFYKKARIIVLYIGKDSKILDLLKKTIGSQFAGTN